MSYVCTGHPLENTSTLFEGRMMKHSKLSVKMVLVCQHFRRVCRSGWMSLCSDCKTPWKNVILPFIVLTQKKERFTYKLIRKSSLSYVQFAEKSFRELPLKNFKGMAGKISVDGPPPTSMLDPSLVLTANE